MKKITLYYEFFFFKNETFLHILIKYALIRADILTNSLEWIMQIWQKRLLRYN